MPTYRIAFVNPYVTAAEVQAFSSLRAAAEAMGITLEHRKPKDLREDDTYDFLIPVAFTPKITSHPSLLSCHSPRSVYVDSEAMFGAIASHDGYLTISENLKTFFGGLSSAYGKPLTTVGDYYNCPQTTDLQTNIAALSAADGLGLCYFGINWDMRAEPLFRVLSQQPYMRIYGPADSWRTVRPQAYKGQLPFDGSSVQAEYARFGVGLVCLGYEHLMDDIISNRVFEISSVGAVSISPDTPWMRKHFGESVFYYDPFCPDRSDRLADRRRLPGDPRRSRRGAEAGRQGAGDLRGTVPCRGDAARRGGALRAMEGVGGDPARPCGGRHRCDRPRRRHGPARDAGFAAPTARGPNTGAAGRTVVGRRRGAPRRPVR